MASDMNATSVRSTDGAVSSPKPAHSTPVKLTDPSMLAAKAKDILGGRMGVATAGYSAPPKGTPYEKNTATFLEAFAERARSCGGAGFVTSPTASAGSIDALTTVAAHKADAPTVYVTAESYLKYIEPDSFPAGVDKSRFEKTPIYFYDDAADYSRATAAGSSALLVTGGRDTTVSDFKNAIEKGNKVVILADREVVTRDEQGRIQQFDAKGRVDNASLYLQEVIGQLKRNDGLQFRELESVGFDKAWVGAHRSELLQNVRVVDGSDPAAAGREAASFVGLRPAVQPPCRATSADESRFEAPQREGAWGQKFGAEAGRPADVTVIPQSNKPLW